MPKKMCALGAALFNSGMSNDAVCVCVDSMVAPFGRRTVQSKVFLDLTLFKRGALTNRKLPVHPESTMDVSCG
jgi:hypothetical protein